MRLPKNVLTVGLLLIRLPSRFYGATNQTPNNTTSSVKAQSREPSLVQGKSAGPAHGMGLALGLMLSGAANLCAAVIIALMTATNNRLRAVRLDLGAGDDGLPAHLFSLDEGVELRARAADG